MVTQVLAPGGDGSTLAGRFRLPKRVPPFNTATYRIFTIIWVIALLVALFGPALALYDRYTSAGNNSQLLLGSRAGFAVSPQDATKVRFLVGPQAGESGIRKGDDIVAIFGIPVPAIMPVTEPALNANANDPAYIAMGSLLFGTDDLPVPLTVRSKDGSVREVIVTTGEDHINDAAREIGVPPAFLNFIDVIHVVFYPFLIWAAWILHRRNSRDAVSSLLSLAILLLIGAELPSSAYLSGIGVPRPVHVVMYDLGNVLLIAGILLFPHGNLSRKLAILLVATPFLMLLQGQLYRSYFLILLALAVLMQIRSLKRAESSDLKQQIRWALFGFSGYAFFNALAYTADFFKWSAGNFGTQLTLELGAGLSFGLSMLVLQLGLLVALLGWAIKIAIIGIVLFALAIDIIIIAIGAYWS